MRRQHGRNYCSEEVVKGRGCRPSRGTVLEHSGGECRVCVESVEREQEVNKGEQCFVCLLTMTMFLIPAALFSASARSPKLTRLARVGAAGCTLPRTRKEKQREASSAGLAEAADSTSIHRYQQSPCANVLLELAVRVCLKSVPTLRDCGMLTYSRPSRRSGSSSPRSSLWQSQLHIRRPS
jgi:hypothetical protein